MNRLLPAVAALIMVWSLANPVAARGGSLYDRLGGESVLRAVVDQLYACLKTNPVTADRFADVNMDRLTNQAFVFLAQATGGPFHYIGKDLHHVHAKLKISEAEWKVTLSILASALDQYKVGPAEKAEFLELIETLKPDIVTTHASH